MESGNYGRAEIYWLPETKNSKGCIKKIVGIIGFVLAIVSVFAAAYITLTYKWSQSTWSDLTINEIIYHLMMPMEGTGTGMLMGHIVKCLIPSIIIAAAFVAAMVVLKKKITFTALIKGLAAALSILIIANTVASFWKNMDVSAYVSNQSSYSSFIDENYVDPSQVTLTFPEKKRNLIYIFLESMENTFADTSVGGAFEENVIPELTQISLENENFSGGDAKLNGGVPMTGTTWTMGAMFAQTSGLPLNISIEKNGMSSQTEFFPGATTLGDILDGEGYNQTLLLGSDVAFGGRELYFTTHGNYNIRDYKYYTSNGTLPSDYYVWWGYEDKYLFENAKTELAELYAQGQPFNLTMLTVDTHFEDGYVCSECEDNYSVQYSNVYACSSKQVSAFLEWLKEQPYYEDTTIVISGDHLTMDSDYCNDVSDDYERKVYTTIINGASQREEQTYREYTTFDNFPTTLAAMGVTIPGNKLALGTNLYSNESTLLEIYGKEEFNAGLAGKSELMENLTAGITQKMVTVTPLEYNSETQTVQIIASDFNGEQAFDKLRATVTPENGSSSAKNFFAEDRGDGTWIFNIPFSELNYVNGTYNVVVGTNFDSVSYTNIGYTTFTIDDPSFENTVPENTVYGLNVTDYDYATGYFTAEYAANDSSIVSVTFAVWKNEDQSDLHWYQAELGTDGVYRANIYAFDYGFDDKNFTIHAYVTSTDGSSSVKATKTYKEQ